MNNSNKTTRELAIENGKVWQVYPEGEVDNILFEGTRSKCKTYIAQNCPQSYKRGEIRLAKVIFEILNPKTEQPKPEVLEGNKGDILAKWYLIPNSFKPMGELRDCIMVEMEMNVINDLEEENKSLREANERMKEALKWIDKKSFGFIHWTDMDEINSKAKEALQANPNK